MSCTGRRVVPAASLRLLFVLFFLRAGSLCHGERPNIVLIMADDMGFSDIGCYGGEIQTLLLMRWRPVDCDSPSSTTRVAAVRRGLPC